MTSPNAFTVMCKALMLAAILSLAGLMYSLFLIGVSATGFLFGLSMALLIFAMVVFGAVVMYLE